MHQVQSRSRRVLAVRVLQISPSVPDPESNFIGGAERYVLSLYEELKSSVGNSMDIRLLSFAQKPSEVARFRQRGIITFRHWPVWGMGGLPDPRFLRLLSAYDVIHVYQWHYWASNLAVFWAHKLGIPTVVTELGGSCIAPSRFGLTQHNIDAVLSISAYSLRSSGIKGRRLNAVIYGGAAFPLRPSPRTTHNGRALFVGRILPHKGLETLIEALPPDMGLDIAGPVMDRTYAQFLLKLSNGRDVQWLGLVPDHILLHLYAEAAATVLPSTTRDYRGRRWGRPELLGLSLVDSLSQGTPVVATRIGGVDEVCIDGVTGLLFDAGDTFALRRVLEEVSNNGSLFINLSEGAVALAQKRFRWSAVSDLVRDAYEQLIS